MAKASGGVRKKASGGGGAASGPGFKRVEGQELAKSVGKKMGADVRYWEKGDQKRLYINGGPVFNTKKVKQTAFIDVKTGKVNVFTQSGQPMNWNITQSKILSDRLERYGRFARRFYRDNK
jgi:hypothetical protein